jgi:hypothetical protein
MSYMECPESGTQELYDPKCWLWRNRRVSYSNYESVQLLRRVQLLGPVRYLCHGYKAAEAI